MIIYFCHSDVPNLDQKLHIINAWHLTAVYVVFVLLLILIQLTFSQGKIGKKNHIQRVMMKFTLLFLIY